MRCDICTQECEKDPTHLKLYVNGSEGITVCLNCRIALTEHVRQIKSIVNMAKKVSYKAGLDKNKHSWVK